MHFLLILAENNSEFSSNFPICREKITSAFYSNCGSARKKRAELRKAQLTFEKMFYKPPNQ